MPAEIAATLLHVMAAPNQQGNPGARLQAGCASLLTFFSPHLSLAPSRLNALRGGVGLQQHAHQLLALLRLLALLSSGLSGGRSCLRSSSSHGLRRSLCTGQTVQAWDDVSALFAASAQAIETVTHCPT